MTFFCAHKVTTVGALRSLLGILARLSQVMLAGVTFTYELRSQLASHRSSKRSAPLSLTAGMRADVATWLKFLDSWNGNTMIIPSKCVAVSFYGNFSDAADWGGGGIHLGLKQWFQHRWSPEEAALDISVRELIVSLMIFARWGRDWQGQTVIIKSDNLVIVLASHRR